jgi:excisionase family DNA binding protein
MLGIRDAAKLLSVSADTIRRLVQDGQLPAMRCGRGRVKGHVRIRRTDLDAFIERRLNEGV